TLPKLYSVASSDYHDITSGNNGYPAAAGYDLVTGRGSPLAQRIAADLVGVSSHFGVSTPPAATAGSGFSVTVSALDQNNNLISNYSGTVHFTSSDGTATLPGDYTFDPTEGGVHIFGAVTLLTAGPQTLNVLDTANSAMT